MFTTRMGGKVLLLATILLVLTSSASSSGRPCCKGTNLIVKRKCIDGHNMTALTCPQKYMINATSSKELQVDEQDNLIISKSEVPPDRYCVTQMNGTGQDFYLVCFDDEDVLKTRSFIVVAVLELISVFFIILTLVIYLKVPGLLDIQGICIFHSISGLAVSFLVLGINQLSSSAFQRDLCISFAYVIYLSMIYAFFWLNILSFHIWRIIVKPKLLSRIKCWTRIYHAVGIGGPTILLILLLVAHYSTILQFSDMHPGFGETKCWFKSMKSQFIYFYGPIAILLCFNIIYYFWTITILLKEIPKSDERNAKVLKYRFALCVKLFFIMGITWIFEILSAAFQESHYILEYCWIITDCLNTLQGILIFLILVVLRKRVVRGLANRSFCGTRLPGKWRTVADDECEEMEEEFGLSETQMQKT